MGTIKTNNEALNEGAIIIEKAFNDGHSAMMDIYKQQTELPIKIYNDLVNSDTNNGNESVQNNGIRNMFSGMDMTKWLVNTMLISMDKTMKQVMEMNQKTFSAFANSVQSKEINSESMNEEYKKLLEIRLKDSKEMLNTITEACNKQLESSMATNKKTMEEISNQFSLAMKQNQKLWSDMLNTHQVSPINDKRKEVSLSEIKTPLNGTLADKK